MKWLRKLFKKRRLAFESHLITAGSDIEHKHAVCFRKVNGLWCICVYKCDSDGWVAFGDESKFICAIPLKRTISLANEKKYLWEE